MFSNNEILNALGKVIHPEKRKDIVTLGMITDIESNEKGISFTIVPERSNDPFISSIRSSLTRILKEELGSEAVINEIRIQPKTIVGKQVEKPAEVLPGERLKITK